MSNHTMLIGAEDVRAAGNAMRSAADQMQSAAMAIETVLERHARFLDDWLMRFEQSIAPLARSTESASSPEYPTLREGFTPPLEKPVRGGNVEVAHADLVITTSGKVLKSKYADMEVLIVDGEDRSGESL